MFSKRASPLEQESSNELRTKRTIPLASEKQLSQSHAREAMRTTRRAFGEADAARTDSIYTEESISEELLMNTVPTSRPTANPPDSQSFNYGNNFYKRKEQT